MTGLAFDQAANDDRPQENALLTLETVVQEGWIDYNGHLTEWRYYKLLADAGENFLRAMGFCEEYRLKGFSFFSVEGHLRNLRECGLGIRLQIYTETVGVDDLRLPHLSVCPGCDARSRSGHRRTHDDPRGHRQAQGGSGKRIHEGLLAEGVDKMAAS